MLVGCQLAEPDLASKIGSTLIFRAGEKNAGDRYSFYPEGYNTVFVIPDQLPSPVAVRFLWWALKFINISNSLLGQSCRYLTFRAWSHNQRRQNFL